MRTQRSLNCSHITLKRGVYYYRRRLPRPLKGEVTLSLHTKAFRRAAFLAKALDEAFLRAIHCKPAVHSTIQQALQTYLSELEREDLERHIDTPPRQRVYRWMESDVPSDDPIDADIDVVGWFLEEAREALARRDTRSVRATVEQLAQRFGISQEHHALLGFGILDAHVKALEASLARVRTGPQPFQLSTEIVASRPAHAIPADETGRDSVPSISFAEATEKYLAVVDGGLATQTALQYAGTFRLFEACFPAAPLRSVTRKQLSDFYTVLQKLPALYDKDRRWRDLSARAAVAASEGIELKRLAPKTMKRHFTALSGLFEFARSHGEYEGENPARGFKFIKKGKARDDRKGWPVEKLRVLFTSPAWHGCKSAWHRSKPGSCLPLDAKFWLPLLAVFHGNRLEEFAQLKRGDLKQREGVWYFDINEEGENRVKNAHSIRAVPLHPKLIELGFLRWVALDAGAAATQPLFDDLEQQGPDEKYGRSITKWFGRYCDKFGLQDEKLVFHSFRHTVTTRLTAANVNRTLIDQLTGHASEGETGGRYTDTLSGGYMAQLRDALQCLQYVELEDVFADLAQRVAAELSALEASRSS